ncbi:MAG: hypothetical protein NDJ89_10975 [Oligoflexia bacterium]|nr:hypothetical protein [Oligoflexia bacterium]
MKKQSVALILAGLMALAAAPAPSVPPSAQVSRTLESDGYRFQVELDRAAGLASVTSLRRRGELPREMNLLLFQDEFTGETVRLQPVAPQDPSKTPEYQGRISPQAGRFVAFELQFGIGGRRFKRFRAELTPEPATAAGIAGNR